jgi:hypothetical protein
VTRHDDTPRPFGMLINIMVATVAPARPAFHSISTFFLTSAVGWPNNVLLRSDGG